MNADDVQLLPTLAEEVNGINLYAYCGNNPVMAVDPNGTWSWKAFWKVVGAVAIVVGVTVGVVLTAGAVAFVAGGFAVAAGAMTATAAATMVQGVILGAAIGGIVSGGLEIISQIDIKGAKNLDFTAIAIEAFSGSAFGAVTGALGTTSSIVSKTILRILNVAISGLRTGLHTYHNGGSREEIFQSVAISVIFSSIFQGLSKNLKTQSFGKVMLSIGFSGAGRAFVRYFKLNLLPYYIFAVKVAAQGIKDFFKNFKYYWSPNN